MLMLLSVSMLTMSSVSTRSSAVNNHQQIAEANARMAAMIALGELQKYAGPDQRVTFNASVLDDTPESEAITGVKHPYWVGITRTDGFKSEAAGTPIITTQNDGLIDRRKDNYDRKDNILAWLVSGQNIDPSQDYDNQALVASNGEINGDVYAPIVDIKSTNQNGSYAYWVSDESSKINLSLFDPKRSNTPTLTNTQSLSKLLVSQAPNLSSQFPNLANTDSTEISKILTHNQTALTSIGHGSGYGSVAEQAKAMIHDVTPFSQSILTDTLNGGLKKNLTAYLESSGNVPALGNMIGISDSDTMLASKNRETTGPKFGAIRDWYNLKDAASGTLGSRTLQAQLPNNINNAGVDPTKYTKQAIHPVIASAQYYANYTYDRVSREIIELVYPKVVLWNPYNIKLETKGMYVLWDFKMNRACKVTYKIDDADGNETTEILNANGNYNWGYNKQRGYFFYIPPSTFEPGEALTFTTPQQGANYIGKGKLLQESRPELNPLSATTDPSELHCYYRKKFGGNIKKLPDGAKLDTMTASYDGTLWDGNRETQTVNLYAAEGNNSNPVYNELGNTQFPKIQQIHLDNYSRGNNGRWMPYYPMGKMYDVTEVLGSDQPPKSLIGFGVRFKHFYESFSNRAYGGPLKEPWYYAPIIHSNVRAGRSHRWPTDNIFGIRYTGTAGTSGARAHLYTFGPYAQERQFREWSDSAALPILSDKGNYISSVFQDNSNLTPTERNTLFDIPAKDVPLFSLASFQHAQLTPYVWDPSYIIGTGYANPHLPLDKSSYSTSERNERWATKIAQFENGNNSNVHLRANINGNPMIYDIAYETNHGLWDKYFLSSIPNDASYWNGDTWNSANEMPNSNMSFNTSVEDSDQKTNLQDFHKAAQALIQRGAFNANSTSVTAWKALLSSFNELDHPSRLGNSTTDADLKHPYSRFIVPHDVSGDSPDVTDSLLWSGHRKLSDEQIEQLAQQIVVQVKRRAPFIGLSDFVNRRLISGTGSESELALFGTIQASINNANLNSNLDDSSNLNSSLPKEDEALEFQYGALYWGGPAFTPYAQLYKTFEYGSKAISEAAAAPGYITQADILQKLGPNLTVRGDTFVIRAYGESKDSGGNVKAKALCELVVQRSVFPIQPDPATENLNPIEDENSLGRKFDVISFRWVNEKESTPSN